MPEISVIIPAYNSASTIREAIESVWAQNFSCHEIIVVDDASTDDTVRIAESASIPLRSETMVGQVGVDRRLRILSLDKNSGPAAARNRGIAEAKGEWIAFLDGDDAWLPGKLEMQMKYVKQDPDVAIVCGKTCGFKEDAKPRMNTDEHGLRKDNSGFRQIHLDEFALGNSIATSTVMVRKDVVLAVGGFDEQFRGPEDYDLWMRIAANHAIILCSLPLARYRETPGSLSMDDRRFLPMVLKVLEKAFGQGGVFSGRRDLYSSAVSNQYWNASWMAFNRGSRLAAIRCWLISYFQNMRATKRVERKWFSLLVRYCFGAATTS